MKFKEILENQHFELQRQRALVNESFALENREKMILALESAGAENADLFLQIFEAVDELPMNEADVKKIEKEFETTKVQLLSDKKGNKSYAVISPSKVVYVTSSDASGGSGKELIMSPAEWKVLSAQLRESGVTPVTGKGKFREYVDFMLKTLKWMSYAAAAIAVVGIIMVAISTGVAFHAQGGGAALATIASRWLPFSGTFGSAFTPWKGNHTDMLWALTSGKAAKVSGEYIVGMSGAIGKALKATFSAITG